MPLSDAIRDIVQRLREGRFANEQAISQGVVLRVFHELGWPTWDTTLVSPEFSTGGGRVDYALCHPPNRPAVFVEVKQPGKADNATRQALEYAFHTGVPFVVLTDGTTWSFYLPAEQGNYEERRVYKLDLFERPPDEASALLTKYLSRTAVESGQALEKARQEYRSRSRRAQARNAIPEAWRELVENGDEILVELAADAVESKVGIRPEGDDIIDFFKSLNRTQAIPNGRGAYSTVGTTPIQLLPPPTTPPQAAPTPRTCILKFLQKEHKFRNAKDAMTAALRMLAERDSGFLERCARHPKMQGKKRRYIARTPEELYPFRPDLQGYHESLPGGWVVSTNLNNQLKKQIVRNATEVAGLKYGNDIGVDF